MDYLIRNSNNRGVISFCCERNRGKPFYMRIWCEPVPQRQILDSSKLNEFADDNLECAENGRKLS